ncbi:hypothetical protein YTPLAS73_09630 [Nitrosarchaeum sp.]|nr:hypothetical protein YTPLAS73_09630 [Nitrosarchaeum sp.]
MKRVYQYDVSHVMTNQKSNKSQSETTIDFGEKRVPRQNYSRVITLDKDALKNCGCDVSQNAEIRARVELVKSSDGAYIRITPFCDTQKEEEQN